MRISHSASFFKGRPTIIKLKTKLEGDETLLPLSDIRVTITSIPQKMHPNNNASNFSTDLSETISLFGSQWYVGLINCSLPTRFNLPFDESERVVTFRIVTTSNSIQRRTVIIPQDVQSTRVVINAFQQVVLSTEAEFSIDGLTKGIEIKAKRPLEMYMKGELGYFLGFPSNHKNLGISKIRLRINQEMVMQNIVRFTEYNPHAFFIYSQFMQSTIIGNRSMKLMKIVPANHSKIEYGTTSSDVKSLDFKAIDFHPVTSTFLSTLDFQIRTHTGELARFSGSNPTLLTLLFTQKPNDR